MIGSADSKTGKAGRVRLGAAVTTAGVEGEEAAEDETADDEAAEEEATGDVAEEEAAREERADEEAADEEAADGAATADWTEEDVDEDTTADSVCDETAGVARSVGMEVAAVNPAADEEPLVLGTSNDDGTKVDTRGVGDGRINEAISDASEDAREDARGLGMEDGLEEAEVSEDLVDRAEADDGIEEEDVAKKAEEDWSADESEAEVARGDGDELDPADWPQSFTR